MPSLHPASTQDLPVIERLAHRIWPPTFGDILSAEQIAYMLDRMYSQSALAEQVQQGHRLMLLKDAETPIGYVSYQLDYLENTTKIHKLYLLPERHGQGLGKMMIHAVRDIARESGQHKLRLDVNYQNPAVPFYEHLGFRKIDRVDTEIGRGFLMEDYVMEMELN